MISLVNDNADRSRRRLVPSIYLTNLGTVGAVRRGDAKPRSAASVGPGPVLSIMRYPPVWGASTLRGQVLRLTPTDALLKAAKAGLKGEPGGIPFSEYGDCLRALWKLPLGPGDLAMAEPVAGRDDGCARWDGWWWRPTGTVPDGATLVCSCGVGKPCHRQIAAPLLSAAGWTVFLDGVRQESANG